MEQIQNHAISAKYKILEMTMNPTICSYLMKQPIVITLLLAVIILRLCFNNLRKKSRVNTKKNLKQRNESRKAWRNTCDL